MSKYFNVFVLENKNLTRDDLKHYSNATIKRKSFQKNIGINFVSTEIFENKKDAIEKIIFMSIFHFSFMFRNNIFYENDLTISCENCGNLFEGQVFYEKFVHCPKCNFDLEIN